MKIYRNVHALLVRPYLLLYFVIAWTAKLPELLKPHGLLMTVEDLHQPITDIEYLLQNRCVVVSSAKEVMDIIMGG